MKRHDIEKIYEKFFKEKGLKFNSVKGTFESLNNKLGELEEYQYVQDTKLYDGENLDSYHVIYKLKFKSGRTCQGNFNIPINRSINQPYLKKIEEFSIIWGDAKDENISLFFFAAHL